MKFYDKALKTNIPPVDSNAYAQLRERIAVGIYEAEFGTGSFLRSQVSGKDWNHYMNLAEGALNGAYRHQHHRLVVAEDPKLFPTFLDTVIQPVLNAIFMVIMVILFPILWPIIRRKEREAARDYEEYKAEKAAEKED